MAYILWGWFVFIAAAVSRANLNIHRTQALKESTINYTRFLIDSLLFVALLVFSELISHSWHPEFNTIPDCTMFAFVCGWVIGYSLYFSGKYKLNFISGIVATFAIAGQIYFTIRHLS